MRVEGRLMGLTEQEMLDYEQRCAQMSDLELVRTARRVEEPAPLTLPELLSAFSQYMHSFNESMKTTASMAMPLAVLSGTVPLEEAEDRPGHAVCMLDFSGQDDESQQRSKMGCLAAVRRLSHDSAANGALFISEAYAAKYDRYAVQPKDNPESIEIVYAILETSGAEWVSSVPITHYSDGGRSYDVEALIKGFAPREVGLGGPLTCWLFQNWLRMMEITLEQDEAEARGS